MTRRLLEQSYEMLRRYWDRLEGRPVSSLSDESGRVSDLLMRLEAGLAARVGSTVCPACSRVYPQHAGDAEANSQAESCQECLTEHGAPRAVALLTGRPPCIVNASPIVLSFYCECSRNVTAGNAGEIGTLACPGCWKKIHAEDSLEEGDTT